MTETDKQQLLSVYDVVFEHLTVAIDHMEGIGHHVDNGDIQTTDLDRGIMESIHDDMVDAQVLLLMYTKELKNRK